MPNRNDAEDRATSAGGNDSGRSQQGGRRSNRGFASMDRGKQKEIASKGGRAAHAKGTAHEFDSNEARDAGRKGGLAVSRNREHMAMIGRRGGEARGQSRGRSANPANSQGAGANSEGAYQNTRANLADRDVTPRAQTEAGHGPGPSGTRSGTTGIGSERHGAQGSGMESSQPSNVDRDRDNYGNH